MTSVYQNVHGWWYWSDETGNEGGGPYDSRLLASAAQLIYAHWLETGEEYTLTEVEK